MIFKDNGDAFCDASRSHPVDVDVMSVSTGDIILREIGNLKSAIPSINTAIADLDIAGIFSEELPKLQKRQNCRTPKKLR